MADKKISAEESQKILLPLLDLPDNKLCADCGAKGPRWASANLGVFICIRCSGLHRSIGTHVTQVRSVSLDKWTPEQLKTMQNVGNGKAAEIYEYNVPAVHKRPVETDDSYTVEQWIRNKYERKLFMRRDGKVRDESSSSANRGRAPKEVAPETRKSEQPKKPTSTANTAPKKPAPSLIDWDAPANPSEEEFTEFSGFSSPQPQVHSPTSASSIQFGNFMGSSSGNSDVEAAFFSADTNSSPVTTPTAQQPKPSKDAILSLYSSPTSSTVPTMVKPANQPNRPVPTANYNVNLNAIMGNGPAPVQVAPVAYVPHTGYAPVPQPVHMGMPHMNMNVPTMPMANTGYVNPNFANMMMSNPGMMAPTQPSYANPGYLSHTLNPTAYLRDM